MTRNKPRNRVVLWFAATLLALLGIGLWYQGAWEPAPIPEAAAAGPSVPEVGRLAGDFQLTDLAGKQVRLADFRGKPVFLNFWATWCTYCRQEFPAILEAYQEYGRTGKVAFVLVDVGESPDAVKKYLGGTELPVVLLDRNGAVAQRYLVQGLPTSFFLSSDGIIRNKVVGAVDGKQLRTILDSLIR